MIFEKALEEAAGVLERFMQDRKNLERMEIAGTMFVECLNSGGKVLACGNGGSMSDAMHFAEELTGRFRNHRDPLPAMALSDPAHMSCVANDYGYDQVFSRMVQAFGRKGDLLLAISTSGNSANILRAAEVAHDTGMKVVALSGKDGGQLAALSDVEIRIPHNGYSDRIQEMHIKIIHCLIEYIETNTG